MNLYNLKTKPSYIMQDEVFFKYFKKNSRSSSPPIKKTLNELLGFPFKISSPKKRGISPENLPNISHTNFKSEKKIIKKIETSPIIVGKEVAFENHEKLFCKSNPNNQEESRPSTQIKRNKNQKLVLVEDNDNKIIKKYKELREHCIENEIKFVKYYNQLKEEVASNNYSEKSLSLALDILEILNQKFHFQIDDPLNLVIQTLNNFLFLQNKESIERIELILNSKSWEVKKMPVLSIIETMCIEFSKREKICKKNIKEKEMEKEKFLQKIEEANKEKEQISKNVEIIKEEAHNLKEKEFSNLKSRVNIFFKFITNLKDFSNRIRKNTYIK